MMISYKDIKKAINILLLKNFNYEINSSDVKEGFKRPSFFVNFDDVTQYSTETHIHKSLSVGIYFFPTSRDDYSIEILEVQEKLAEVFQLKLPIKERLINVEDMEFQIIDGVLECTFPLEFEYLKETDRYLKYKNEIILDENQEPVKIQNMEHLEIEKGKE